MTSPGMCAALSRAASARSERPCVRTSAPAPKRAPPRRRQQRFAGSGSSCPPCAARVTEARQQPYSPSILHPVPAVRKAIHLHIPRARRRTGLRISVSMSSPPPTAKNDRRAFAALCLATLGVVYGDIGTSPLYTVSQIFFGPNPIPYTPENAVGATSLMLWILTLSVTLKYIVLVLRADHEGQGGTFALLALIQRGTAVSRERRGGPGGSAAGRAWFHAGPGRGPALRRRHHHPGHLGAVGRRRPEGRHEHLRTVRRAGHRRHPHRPVLHPAPWHGAYRHDVRARPRDLVRRDRRHRHWCTSSASLASSGRSTREAPSEFLSRQRPARVGRGPGFRPPGGHRLRGAVRGPRPLRRPADPGHLVLARLSCAAAELPGAGSLCVWRRTGGGWAPLLRARSALGAPAPRGPGDVRDRHRLASPHLRGLLAHPTGDRASGSSLASRSCTRAAPTKARSTFPSSTAPCWSPASSSSWASDRVPGSPRPTDSPSPGVMLVTSLAMMVIAIRVWGWRWYVAVPLFGFFAAIEAVFFSSSSLKILHGAWLPLAVGTHGLRRHDDVAVGAAARGGGLLGALPTVRNGPAAPRTQALGLRPAASPLRRGDGVQARPGSGRPHPPGAAPLLDPPGRPAKAHRHADGSPGLGSLRTHGRGAAGPRDHVPLRPRLRNGGEPPVDLRLHGDARRAPRPGGSQAAEQDQGAGRPAGDGWCWWARRTSPSPRSASWSA